MDRTQDIPPEIDLKTGKEAEGDRGNYKIFIVLILLALLYFKTGYLDFLKNKSVSVFENSSSSINTDININYTLQITSTNGPVYGAEVIYDGLTHYTDRDGRVVLIGSSSVVQVKNGFNEQDFYEVKSVLVPGINDIKVELVGILDAINLKFERQPQLVKDTYILNKNTLYTFIFNTNPIGVVRCGIVGLSNISLFNSFYIYPLVGEAYGLKGLNLKEGDLILTNMTKSTTWYVDFKPIKAGDFDFIVGLCDGYQYKTSFVVQ